MEYRATWLSGIEPSEEEREIGDQIATILARQVFFAQCDYLTNESQNALIPPDLRIDSNCSVFLFGGLGTAVRGGRTTFDPSPVAYRFSSIPGDTNLIGAPLNLWHPQIEFYKPYDAYYSVMPEGPPQYSTGDHGTLGYRRYLLKLYTHPFKLWGEGGVSDPTLRTRILRAVFIDGGLSDRIADTLSRVTQKGIDEFLSSDMMNPTAGLKRELKIAEDNVRSYEEQLTSCIREWKSVCRSLKALETEGPQKKDDILKRLSAFPILDMDTLRTSKNLRTDAMTTLIITTRPLVISLPGGDIPMGKYEIEIRSDGKVKVFRKMKSIVMGASQHHPHISHEGNPCFGGSANTMASMRASADLVGMISIISHWIQVFDSESPFIQMSEFLSACRIYITDYMRFRESMGDLTPTPTVRNIGAERATDNDNLFDISDIEEDPTEEDIVDLGDVVREVSPGPTARASAVADSSSMMYTVTMPAPEGLLQDDAGERARAIWLEARNLAIREARRLNSRPPSPEQTERPY